jgi:hypothetical protein
MTDITITPELQEYLAADATLASLASGGVWEDPAPANQNAPIVVLLYETAEDETCGGGSRVTRFYYVVKVVGPAVMIETIRQAALRLDALLHFGPIAQDHLPGYNVMAAKRNEPIAYPDPEPTTGVRYMHRGGRYQFDVEAA